MQLTDEQAAEIASAWHSVMTWNDPGVVMYSVTSTGKVHSEKHRAALLTYIDSECLPHAADLDAQGEEPILFESNTADLTALRAWVAAYRVAKEGR